MRQSDLDRQVARATGESIRTIGRRGFSIAKLEEPRFDPEPSDCRPQLVDWDAVDARRTRTYVTQGRPIRIVA